MLTHKKRKFVAALKRGLSNRQAAIDAGYSEKTASQAGARLAKDLDVQAHMSRQDPVGRLQNAGKNTGVPFDFGGKAQRHDDPLDFLATVMNDASEDMRLRMDAAKTLMPYLHVRKGEGGKKDARQDAAQKVASRFNACAPPQHWMQ